MPQHGEMQYDSTGRAAYVFLQEKGKFVRVGELGLLEKSVEQELLAAMKPFAEAAVLLELPRILNEGWVNAGRLVTGLDKLIIYKQLEDLRRVYVKHTDS